MNILHTECGMNWGGQEYRTLLEHNHLNENHHTSHLACHPGSELFKRAKKMGAANLLAVDFRKVWRLDVAAKIWRFCRAHRIDIINTHGGRDSSLCLFAFWSGIPLVRSRHITAPIKRSRSYRKSCSHIIAAAAAIKTQLTALGVAAEKITVIGEGVDLAEYKPQSENENSTEKLSAEFNIRPEETVIVNIGMIRADKGQRFYLEAADLALKENPNLRFFLIGAGTGTRELERELRAEVRRRKLEANFTMTGYRADIADFLRLADFAVIASTGVEAQSRVAPQAFACAKPVIAANTGGLPELVRDGDTGLLVPPANAAALSDAVLRLAGDAALREKLAQNAYQFARERLSFSAMMEKTLALYAELAR